MPSRRDMARVTLFIGSLFLVHWIFLTKVYKRTYFCPLVGQHTQHDTHFWWSSGVNNHTSRHMLDIWSVTHFERGLLFCLVIHTLLAKWNKLRHFVDKKLCGTAIFCIMLVLGTEVCWELIENSPWIGKTYSRSMVYMGDSYTNSLCDVFSFFAGYLVAKQLKLNAIELLPIMLCIEAVLAMIMRDNWAFSLINLCGNMMFHTPASRPEIYANFISWQCSAVDKSIVSSYCGDVS